MRNKLQFNNVNLSTTNVASHSLSFAKDVTRAFSKNKKNSSIPNGTLINWKFLVVGCLKINTDGSNLADDHCGSFGGIVRSNTRKWVEGFI